VSLNLTPGERVVAIVNTLYIAVFGSIAAGRSNHEFLMYAGVIVALFVLILIRQPRTKFPPIILWGLTCWGFAHMAGGNLFVGDAVLYEWQALPGLLRFDQLVHFFGFGTATLVCHHLLSPHLNPNRTRGFGFWCLVVMMGCGVGSLNEIVEFIAVLSIPETGVGGYENTMWDMAFNLLGASTAAAFLAFRSNPNQHQPKTG
jgi:Predicted membrane protein (DUF2238)